MSSCALPASALADQAGERAEVGDGERRVGAKILAVEIRPGVAGQLRRGGRDVQPLDRQLLRPRLRDRDAPAPPDRRRSRRGRPAAGPAPARRAPSRVRRRLSASAMPMAASARASPWASTSRSPFQSSSGPLPVSASVNAPAAASPVSAARSPPVSSAFTARSRVAGSSCRVASSAGAGGRLVDALQRQLRRRRAAILRVSRWPCSAKLAGCPSTSWPRSSSATDSCCRVVGGSQSGSSGRRKRLGWLGLRLGRRQPVHGGSGRR